MDECRKRVLAIIAGIVVARHLRTTEDLSTTVRARGRVPGCVGGSVGGAHHAEGGQPHCQQMTTRPGHSLACTFPLLFHCWLRENPLGVVIPKSRLRGALRRPSRMGPELARVLKVMTASILRMALYWY